MATKKTVAPSARLANLTSAQMREALPRLSRRLKEVEEFTFNVTEEEVRAAAGDIQRKLDDTLVGVFGIDTVEYERYKISSLYEGSHTILMVSMQRERTRQEKIQPYQAGFATAARRLRTIIDIFTEKLEYSNETLAYPTRALESLLLHPQIADASVDLFKGGHYANAIEDACKVLDMLVKMKSKREDRSGTELMQLAFSPKSPLLKFNEQQNDSEKSEQLGMMNLYSGVMLAFRNPRAHGLLNDDPIVALEIIGFVNFLAKTLDRAKRT